MRILVTGGCGYVGSVLVPRLVGAEHHVDVWDTGWFGSPVPGTITQDVREPEVGLLEGVDCIIHLASVANDPCANLAPTLTWEVSALGTQKLVEAAIRAKVPRIIYASSASVYGIQAAERVVETLPCVSVTTYNQAKLVAERVLLSYRGDIDVQIVRPATLFGLSPNQRLDVVVNLLTWQALTRGRMTILGGDQQRPNLHIDDMCDLYLWLVEHPEHSGIYNAGHENLTVLQIAEIIREATGAQIVVEPSNDPRSYRLDSTKLAICGWTPKRTVAEGVNEICDAYHSRKLIERDEMRRVDWLRRQGIK